MATARARSPRQRTEYRMTNDQFKDYVAQLAQYQKELVDFAYNLGLQGKGNKLQFGNQEVGKLQLNKLVSEYKAALNTLPRYFVTAGKRKPRAAGARAGGKGFQNPIYVTPKMQQFFARANLGLGPDGRPLQDSIPSLIREGLTTSALLTPLFNIYVDQNRLQELATSNAGKAPADRNNQFLGADRLMNDIFGQDFAALRQYDLNNPRVTKPDKKGVSKPIPAFDPQNFRFASWQSVVSQNRMYTREQADKLRAQGEMVPEDRILSKEQADRLAQAEPVLAREFALVKSINDAIGLRKKADNKAIKAQRRKAKA